jgi:predicted metal-binding membrane protein
MSDLPLAGLLRRERLIVLGGLLGVTLLAWFYLVWMAVMMPVIDLSAMQRPLWTGGYFLMMFTMWVVMMIGMMLPSVGHVVLMYARVVQRSGTPVHPILRTYLFILGYLLAWVGFSLAATLLHWLLDGAILLSPQMRIQSPLLTAGILFVAGAYQFSPAKNACLEHCRGPVDFLSRHWRKGLSGAVRMGFGHGLYCLGCCWVLMVLLFVGGVMNLLVIAAITVFVLLEKLAPYGALAGRLSGAGLMVAAGLLAGSTL